MLSIYLLFFQIFKEVTVEFKREHRIGDSIEVTEGNIYYQTPNKIILQVKKPIHQWIVIEETQMVLYYPNENKGFKIKSKIPFFLPFFQMFIGSFKENYGLSEIGYTITRYEKREDTLFTYWKPPNNLSNILGEALTIYISRKLVYVELKNANGRVINKTSYSNHIYYNGIYFPLNISIIHYNKQDSIVENVIYRDPKFNIPLPPEALNFTIPSNAQIKEIEW